METKYLLVVDYFVPSILDAVRSLRKMPEFANLNIVILTTRPKKYKKLSDTTHPIDVWVERCNFQDPVEIKYKLEPYINDLAAVVCRGDKYIQYLRKIIKYLPANTLVSSAKSLQTATNKQLMRAAFYKKFPEITPKYLEIFDDTNSTLNEIESKIPYPVIVKPANLVSSLLIHSCKNRSDLKKSLTKIFKHINNIYQREGRDDKPQIIVEEYLQGKFYSVDAYILSPDKVFYCPPVSYVPADQLGIDDFFLHKRSIPTELTPDQILAANQTVNKSLNAVGLTYSSAHVELILTDKGWKIIELGPRIGRFRPKMYQLSYNIDHSLNDIKAHLGIEPVIPNRLLLYSSAYSIYPKVEGKLRSIKGLDELKKTAEVNSLRVYKSSGDNCEFAKNGGHAIAEFVIATDDKNRYYEIGQFIEQNVYADIDQL